MYIWIASMFYLLRIMLLWTWVYKQLKTLFSIILSPYSEPDLPSHMTTWMKEWGRVARKGGRPRQTHRTATHGRMHREPETGSRPRRKDQPRKWGRCLFRKWKGLAEPEHGECALNISLPPRKVKMVRSTRESGQVMQRCRGRPPQPCGGWASRLTANAPPKCEWTSLKGGWPRRPRWGRKEDLTFNLKSRCYWEVPSGEPGDHSFGPFQMRSSELKDQVTPRLPPIPESLAS